MQERELKCFKLFKEYLNNPSPENLELLKQTLNKGEDSPLLNKIIVKWSEIHFDLNPQKLWAVFTPLLRAEGETRYNTSSPDKEVKRDYPIRLFLHNIRSSHNLGALTRTAEFFGCQSVVCSGYTNPQFNSHFQKASMQSEKFISFERVESPWKYLEDENKKGTYIIGAETLDQSITLEDSNPRPGPLLILLGNEEFGLEGHLLDYCHEYVKIPGFGRKGSLNITSAAACFLNHYQQNFKKNKE